MSCDEVHFYCKFMLRYFSRKIGLQAYRKDWNNFEIAEFQRQDLPTRIPEYLHNQTISILNQIFTITFVFERWWLNVHFISIRQLIIYCLLKFQFKRERKKQMQKDQELFNLIETFARNSRKTLVRFSCRGHCVLQRVQEQFPGVK